MTRWLLARIIRRAPRRLVLEAIAVAFPVAMLGATLLFVDGAVQQMTPRALDPVQIEMRAVTGSLDADIRQVTANLSNAGAPGVQRVEPFAAANVVVAPAGGGGQVTARVFAVDPAYIESHPWIRVVSGDLSQGALLDQSLRGQPGFADASSITISLRGDAPNLAVTLPVAGTADLRSATTWFAIPYGDVQGDIVNVPRSLIVDMSVFEQQILPTLRNWAHAGGLPPFDPGSDELPSASLEAHIAIDHHAYPPDPGQAAIWSSQIQRILERSAGAPVVVADETAEPLRISADDATNAKILFLLLGIPGAVVAGALSLAAVASLAESHRREEALLRLRGATSRRIAGLAAAHAAVAGIVGSILGLAIAIVTVTLITGRAAWEGVPADALAVSIALAVLAGVLTTGVRLLRLRRSSQAEVAVERRAVVRGWSPLWLVGRLDLVAIVLGLAILGLNAAFGGLSGVALEGPALALSFYVLLAPLLLWLGLTLLLTRFVLNALKRLSRPGASQQLRSWRSAGFKWLGRRPAQTMAALSLGALAVAFGTNVLAFAATYESAKATDARAAIGSDLRFTPGDPRATLPQLPANVTSVAAVRIVPTRVETDRKFLMAIDPATYLATVTVQPVIIAGQGPEGFAQVPNGILVDSEIATSFGVGPGDLLAITVYPDDFENASDLELPVVGVFTSFPPTSPTVELVMNAASIPRINTVPMDFYLARVDRNQPTATVADSLRTGPLAGLFGVTTAAPPTDRGLTALNVVGLGAIQALGAGLAAALGVAVLGAFLVIERRREFAILRSVGADTRQIITGPAVEATVAVVGSVAIGVPVGLALSILCVRVLGLFFALPPPLIVLPVVPLILLVLFISAASAAAIGAALLAVTRIRAAAVLREP